MQRDQPEFSDTETHVFDQTNGLVDLGSESSRADPERAERARIAQERSLSAMTQGAAAHR